MVGAFGTAHHIIFAVLCGLALTHLCFAVYCFYLGILPLAIAKLTSAGVYLCCCWYKFKNNRTNDLFIALVVLEVCSHALIANYTIGWHSGSSIYLMDVALILALITNTSLLSRLSAILLLLAATIITDSYFADHTPIIQLSDEVINRMRIVNYSLALLIIAVAAMGYQYMLAIANIKMQKLANEDQLTGQLNRRAMIEKSESLIELCSASRTSMCAAIGDLDHFKQINDTFGHTVGDEVLVAVAEAICQNTRSGDLSARWGGEEFVWLMPNTTAEQAQQCLDRLRVSVQELAPNKAQSHWRASISIGFTTVQPNEDFDNVISRADQALYKAKEQGRNRIKFQAAPPANPAQHNAHMQPFAHISTQS